MRIAQVYHDFSQRGGAEKHVENLASSLRDQGHHVTIVSETPPAKFPGFVLNFSRYQAPVSALRLARWMKRERIQLVHAHSRIAALVASLAARLYRAPLVVTSHILPYGFRRTSTWGDQTICVSEAVRRRLIEEYDLPADRVTVIHNGVDINPLAAVLTFGPKPVLSFVARFAPRKGHAMFLEAATSLLKRGFPGTFVLAGDGPLEAGLRTRYSSDRIVFLGYRNDVTAILSSSAASVICSESEAFPYSALESLSVGTPVVSTDCGGPAEIIQSGRNGFLLPVGDAQSLLRLMEAVSQPDSGLATRGEIAQDCRANFGQSRMVEATLNAYGKVCVEDEPPCWKS